MSSIGHYAQQYENHIQSFVSKVAGFESQGNATDRDLRGLDQDLKSINTLKRDLKTELRLLPRDSQEGWKGTIADAEEPLDDAVVRFERLKQAVERKRLLGDRHGNSAAPGKTNDDVLQEANDVQEKTFEAGRRMRNMVNDTEQVADATDAELQRQGEQLRGIRDEVARIDNLLDASKYLVGNVAKRIYTDRILMCFVLVNIILIVAAIAYFATSDNGLTADSEEPTP